MKTPFATLGFVLALLFVLAEKASAQPFAISWFTIDGGGGTSAGGSYSLSGTIGQPDAGLSSGGSFTLSGGFWGAIAIQQEGFPILHIKPAGTNVVLSWTPATTSFVLQVSTSLSAPAWTDAATGSTNPVTLPADLPIRLFRLRKL